MENFKGVALIGLGYDMTTRILERLKGIDICRIVVVDDADSMTEIAKRDLLPHLPLPELEIKELPVKNEKNWKKKKYYGRG